LAGLLGCASNEGPGQGDASAAPDPGGVAAAPGPRSRPAADPQSLADREAASPDSGYLTFLAALHDVQVMARSSGLVTARDVDEGSRVAAGQRLAQVEDDLQRLAVQEREAELATAQAAYERARRLHGEKMLSEQQLLEARSAHEMALARRDRARVEHERCAVRAPISGIVSQRRVQVGQTVKDGDLLFRVVDPETLRAELLLPEEELGRVRAGQPVTVFPRVGGAPVRARVTRTNPVVDAASGTFRVVVELDNRRVGWAPGISVRCRLEPLQAAGRER
jgi:membrane fusion protein (multidrug efflux system)